METEITITEITRDNNINIIAAGSPVVSVNNRIGAVMLSAIDVRLENVDNTSDLDKPISNSTLSALNVLQSQIDFLAPDNTFDVHTIVQTTSANWDDTYSFVNSNSANIVDVDTFVNSNSANVVDVNTFVNLNSANIVDVDTLVNITSANWDDAYSYIISNSGIEANQEEVSTFVNSNSANIVDVDTFVNSNSSNIVDVNTLVNITSSNWDDAYTNIINLSTAYSSVTGVSGTIYEVDVVNTNGNFVLSLPNSIRTPGDLNVGGNLYISGSGFNLTSSTLSVSSPIIYINNSLSGAGNVYDIGLVGHFKTDIYQHTGLVRSAQNNYWSLFSGLTSEPLDGPTLDYNDPNFRIDTLRANILGSLSGNVTGNISGNAESVTNGVYINVSYSNPTWITSLSDSKITGTNRNSWDSVYSTVNSNSAITWNYQGTDLKALSGNWQSTFSTTSSLSSRWNSVFSAVTSTSARWQSAFSTTSSLSSRWNSVFSAVTSTSADWQSNYFNNNQLSGNWQSSYGTVSSLSGSWNDMANFYLHVSSNAISANYIYGSLDETVFTDGSNLNGYGSNTLSLNYLSGIFVSSQINYNGYTSDNWNNTYLNVSANSAVWTAGGNAVALQSLSANWDNTYLNVSANSAVWTAGGNSVALQGLSGNWDSVYSTVNVNSGNWSSYQNTSGNLITNSGGTINGNLTVNTLSATNVNTTTLSISGLSSTYIYGNGIETVLTDGSSLNGNGNNSLTMNYGSGVYINTNLYLSSAKLPSRIYLYDLSGVRWQLTVTTSGTLSTVRA